uniref:uncharacterized protein LOC100182239 isoform X2 n=1 Tax=Ciona intestinalis TaxID=7719 RepID=UPI000EF43D6F|nr:uncharacterized protein LOC100182239 isoform X2 [Ciona intestinalis]|eukprot:XP_026694618.1 uncharacterized protein LOC100182239 isoform X2 [Ciona intestinalis]
MEKENTTKSQVITVVPKLLVKKQPLLKFSSAYIPLVTIQFIAGMSSILLGLAAICIEIYYGQSFFDTGAGIWCGCFFLATGVLGYLADKQSKQCLIIGTMAMSILSAGLACVMFALDFLSMLHGHAAKEKAAVAIHFVLDIIAFGVLLVSVNIAAYSCGAVCCNKNNATDSRNTELPADGKFVNEGQCEKDKTMLI